MTTTPYAELQYEAERAIARSGWDEHPTWRGGARETASLKDYLDQDPILAAVVAARTVAETLAAWEAADQEADQADWSVYASHVAALAAIKLATCTEGIRAAALAPLREIAKADAAYQAAYQAAYPFG